MVIDTGNNLVLSSSYFELNETYSILELLVGLNNTVKYLNDAQLSTSYNYCELYSKKWFLVNNTTKEEFLILETQQGELILNTQKVGDNIEVDYMGIYGNGNFADHYIIPIDDIIDSSIFGDNLNYQSYSIYNNVKIPSFENSNYVKTIETKLDLNNDNNIDNISINFYNGNKMNQNGFSIKINDAIKNYIFLDVSNNIKVIDLDKDDNFKELLFFTNDSMDKNYHLLILSYDGKNIIRTFETNNRLEEFELNPSDLEFEKFNEICLNENNLIPVTYHSIDSIQRWKLQAYLKFKDGHKLVFSKGDNKYYKSLIIRESSSIIDIVLYKEMDFSSDKIDLPKNTDVNFIGTTLDYWGVIEYNNEIYYLPLDNNGQIYGAYTYVSDVFDNLAIYD